MSNHRRFHVHCCALDRECRRWTEGQLWRVEFSTPGMHLGIALSPKSRYVAAGGESRWISYRKKT